MKVYLVKNTYGSYEDVVQSVDKVFDTAEKADQYVFNVKARIRELKKLYDNMSCNNKTDEHDIIYDKAMVKFDADFPDTYYAWDGNRFHVLEREVE